MSAPDPTTESTGNTIASNLKTDASPGILRPFSANPPTNLTSPSRPTNERDKPVKDNGKDPWDEVEKVASLARRGVQEWISEGGSIEDPSVKSVVLAMHLLANANTQLWKDIHSRRMAVIDTQLEAVRKLVEVVGIGSTGETSESSKRNDPITKAAELIPSTSAKPAAKSEPPLVARTWVPALAWPDSGTNTKANASSNPRLLPGVALRNEQYCRQSDSYDPRTHLQTNFINNSFEEERLGDYTWSAACSSSS